MGNAVMEVTDSNFETEVIKANVPALVDFWAPWCAPCRAMGPLVDRLSTEMGAKVKVVKLNTSDSTEVPARYGITAIPTFLVFKGGKVVEQIVGGRPYEELKSFVTKHL